MKSTLLILAVGVTGRYGHMKEKDEFNFNGENSKAGCFIQPIAGILVKSSELYFEIIPILSKLLALPAYVYDAQKFILGAIEKLNISITLELKNHQLM